MEKIPEEKVVEIIDHYLKGKSHLENAKLTGTSTGTVSNVIKRLEKALGKRELREVRKFVVQVKKLGIDLAELPSCIHLQLYLRRTGLDCKQIESSIYTQAMMAADKIPPHKAVSLLGEISHLSDTLGVSIFELPVIIAEKNAELSETTKKVEAGKKRLDEIEVSKQELLRQQMITESELLEYRKFKDTMKTYGMSDAAYLVAIIDYVAKTLGWDKERVVAELKQIAILKEDRAKIKEDVQAIEAVAERQRQTDKISALAATWFITPEQFETFLTKVKEIATAQGITDVQALAQVTIDLSLSYNEAMAHGKKLAELKSETAAAINYLETLRKIAEEHEVAGFERNFICPPLKSDTIISWLIFCKARAPHLIDELLPDLKAYAGLRFEEASLVREYKKSGVKSPSLDAKMQERKAIEEKLQKQFEVPFDSMGPSS